MKINRPARASGDGVGWWKRGSFWYDGVETSNDDRRGYFSSTIERSDVESLWYLADDIGWRFRDVEIESGGPLRRSSNSESDRNHVAKFKTVAEQHANPTP